MKRFKFLTIFLWLVCRSSFLSSTDLSDPYVTCCLGGQLGNQLFQIATTLAYAWDHQVHPVFPALNRPDYNIPINQSRLFFRLDTSPLPREIAHTFTFHRNFAKTTIPYNPDQMLCGFFQSWEFFHHHYHRIVDIFAPSEQEIQQLKSKYGSLINHPMSVGIHVRTFNKTWHSAIPFVGLDYYKRAMDLFPQGTVFIVFSDRINWCKHHFPKFNRPMLFIDGQDHVADFYLMSMLKHNIIGNSTFSWWAAYLNKNPNKIVVAPDYFLHPQAMILLNGEANCNMPGWIVLKINPDAPYPEDMYQYDQYSKSIDTQ